MLSLNSYGLARRSNQNQGISLPRINVHGGHVREIQSLSKLEMMRKTPHPLYQTTSGAEYGKYLDLMDVALTPPKYKKPPGFTTTFITGPYCDTSLTSIDKSKQRAESWKQRMVERTCQMQQKYEEIQKKLEQKKEQRKQERNRRRHEMEEQSEAAIKIQAHLRGFVLRKKYSVEQFTRKSIAASKIQSMYKSRSKVKKAKATLAVKKYEYQSKYAVKIQVARKQYLKRVEAKKELEQRREQKRQSQIEEFQIRDQAAKEVQRIIRGHFARRSYQKSSAHHERDDTFNRKGKFPKKTVGTMNVKRKRQKSICYVPSTTTSIIDKERGEKENKDKKNYY